VRLALVVHPDRARASGIAADLVRAATGLGIEVTAAPEDAARVPGTVPRDPDLPPDADVVVAVGGDGTVLEAVRVALAADLPVLGVNAGHMGFLTQVEPEAAAAALALLVAGEYEESRRMTVATCFPGADPVTGLNDVVVEKTVSQHVVKITVSVGEERLVGYRADAVIVATPTGSTAYTFSAGGPLVDPELDALVVTAVAPHNLFGRPIVFRPGVTLTLRADGDRPARVNLDGRLLGTLDPGREVEIRRGEGSARFIRLTPKHFAATVRDKFRLHDA
jgi:NAD+ kinase